MAAFISFFQKIIEKSKFSSDELNENPDKLSINNINSFSSGVHYELELDDENFIVQSSTNSDASNTMLSCGHCEEVHNLNMNRTMSKNVEGLCTHILYCLNHFTHNAPSRKSLNNNRITSLVDKVPDADLHKWIQSYLKSNKQTELNFKINFAAQLYDKENEKYVHRLVKKVLKTYKTAVHSTNSRSSKGIDLLNKLLDNAIISQQKEEYYISWIISSQLLKSLVNAADKQDLNDEGVEVLHQSIAVMNSLNRSDLPPPLKDSIREELTALFLADKYKIGSIKYHFLPLLKFTMEDENKFVSLINEKIKSTKDISTIFHLMIELLASGQNNNKAIDSFQKHINGLHLIVWQRILFFLKETKQEFLKDIFLENIDLLDNASYDTPLLNFRRNSYAKEDPAKALKLGVQEFELSGNIDIVEDLIELSKSVDDEDVFEEFLDKVIEELPIQKRIIAYQMLELNHRLYLILADTDDIFLLAEYIHLFKGKELKKLSKKILELTSEYLENHAGPPAKKFIKELMAKLNEANKSGVIEQLMDEMHEEFSHRPTLSNIL